MTCTIRRQNPNLKMKQMRTLMVRHPLNFYNVQPLETIPAEEYYKNDYPDEEEDDEDDDFSNSASGAL